MLNAAQRLIQSFFTDHGIYDREYRAPHAYRGTPPRQHYDRSEAKFERRQRYLEGLKKPQPRKYLNKSAQYASMKEF